MKRATGYRLPATGLFFALLLAVPARGEKDPEAAGRAVVQRVQKFYRHAKDFTARFEQLYTYVSFGRTDKASGQVDVKRPDKLRWRVDEPAEKKLVIVINGRDFWQYAPEDNQVSHNANFVSDQLSSAFTFLWGKGELLKEFSARSVARPDVEGLPEGECVELLPRAPNSQVSKLVFVVGKRGEVLASVVTNAQGDTNRLVFHDVKLNAATPDKEFAFTPPAGANVENLQ
jgi:outer membrane lipoprotein carrier protein